MISALLYSSLLHTRKDTPNCSRPAHASNIPTGMQRKYSRDGSPPLPLARRGRFVRPPRRRTRRRGAAKYSSGCGRLLPACDCIFQQHFVVEKRRRRWGAAYRGLRSIRLHPAGVTVATAAERNGHAARAALVGVDSRVFLCMSCVWFRLHDSCAGESEYLRGCARKTTVI